MVTTHAAELEAATRRRRGWLVAAVVVVAMVVLVVSRTVLPAAPAPDGMEPVAYHPPTPHALLEPAVDALAEAGSARFDGRLFVDGRRVLRVWGTTAPRRGEAVWRAAIDGSYGHTHGMVTDGISYRYRRDVGWLLGVTNLSLSDPLGSRAPGSAPSRFDLRLRNPWRSHLLAEIGGDVTDVRALDASEVPARFEDRFASTIDGLSVWELELDPSAVEALSRDAVPADRRVLAWIDQDGRLRRLASRVRPAGGVEQLTTLEWSDFGTDWELYRRR